MGFKNPLELDDLGKLPAKESSAHQYETFIRVFNKTKGCKEVPSLWKCYFLCHWKNFLLGGILKLAGDLVGLVAPLGIAVVVDYAAQSQLAEQSQGIIYGKALKLSLSNQDDESTNTDSKVGNITNLMAEDTFNIMTGLWIGHYIWAIPVKNLCDERLRMTNEMLQGIKALKLCAWETHFCSRLMLSRNKELKFLDRDSLYWALMRQLTAVIGKVGCGKTTFLNALLGEIKCTSGLLKWEKDVSFAYVSQQPWLLNATLRENILMGLSYKPRRFDRVIAATALQPDIDILPNKDLTELGEKGINLSGGQRQRVALARALYSKATTIILDDPLSAVDYHVAQHVFENGIMSLVTKQKKTVIMVTHSWHLLTYAHKVCVNVLFHHLKVIALENGKMRACGKLRDMQLIDGVVTGMEQPDLRFDSRGRTARERWQLVKLVSKLGHHIRQQNIKYQMVTLLLLSEIDMPTLMHQSLKAYIAVSRASMADSSDFALLYWMISSANWEILMEGHRVIHISAVYRLNKMGLGTAPCGNPLW
uniref:ABC transporter domain-containing protein n=1 Tax=Rhodnius prolixus TaxID=13249 RepID=T1H9U9_RHOPR